MNLHALVSPIIGVINPNVPAQYQSSIGTHVTSDFTQVPAYAPAITVTVQRQPIPSKDLAQVQGLNLNGEKCVMYATGAWQDVNRPNTKGGDLITLTDGSVWLTVMMLEDWSFTSGWIKCVCTLQNGS